MNEKQMVAQYAANMISADMIVGLGTGSTANYFIAALAERQFREKLKILTVASSIVSSIKAREAGLPVLAMETVNCLDVYVDGADEVSPDLCLLKGRGADLVREKLLVTASDQFWVLIDSSKRVARIGEKYPIPLEVMPFAWQLVMQSVVAIGGTAKLRTTASGDGLAVSSHGSLILDAVFAPETQPKQLDSLLNAIPGVVEHGIFADMASAVFCAEAGQVNAEWAGK